MKIGIFGINNGPLSDPDAMLDAARRAEAAGIESLWTGEHVILPDPQEPPAPVPPHYPMVDPPVALAFIAAETERVKLGTGIMILPQRNPVVMAKEFGSLDHLSKGRLLFGIGVGYLKPEFDAIGAPFDHKGPRSDEWIDAMRALWVQEKPSFSGRFVSFDGVNAFPRPVQQPPPVHVGGWSAGAYKRSVERGNGWYGFNLDFEGTQGCLDGIRDAEKRFERPAELGELEISVTPPAAMEIDADAVRRFADQGVHRLILLPGAFAKEPTGDAFHAWIDRVARLGDA